MVNEKVNVVYMQKGSKCWCGKKRVNVVNKKVNEANVVNKRYIKCEHGKWKDKCGKIKGHIGWKIGKCGKCGKKRAHAIKDM